MPARAVLSVTSGPGALQVAVILPAPAITRLLEGSTWETLLAGASCCLDRWLWLPLFTVDVTQG